LTDPAAEALLALGAACDGDPGADVARFLRLEMVFPPALASAPAFARALAEAYRALGASGALSEFERP
jgi:mannitol-1-phosphate/altronate dehydrogenase